VSWLAFAGGAGVGTVVATAVGKLLDVWQESRRARQEHRVWLRGARMEAFGKLSEELLSFGLKSRVFDDIWAFRAVAARAELLIDDADLLGDVRGLISDLYDVNAQGLTRAETQVSDDFTFTFSDGTTLSKPDIERGVYFTRLEKRADELVARLGAVIRQP